MTGNSLADTISILIAGHATREDPGAIANSVSGACRARAAVARRHLAAIDAPHVNAQLTEVFRSMVVDVRGNSVTPGAARCCPVLPGACRRQGMWAHGRLQRSRQAARTGHVRRRLRGAAGAQEVDLTGRILTCRSSTAARSGCRGDHLLSGASGLTTAALPAQTAGCAAYGAHVRLSSASRGVARWCG